MVISNSTVLCRNQSSGVDATSPSRVGGTVVCFLVIINFNNSVLAVLPKVDYRVRFSA